jgi:cellulose synthase/poly-beta-1,6-N-acetylglucosamine synthase-like glycosyltransferase
MFLEFILWGAIAINAATYLGYPAVVLALARLRGKGERDENAPDYQGAVSIVVCAHNEANVIARKITSICESNFGGDFEILVGDDGSTDDTTAVIRAISDPRMRLFEFPRSGKAFVLDSLVSKARHDILVFTDADPIWRDDTLSNLITPFAARDIGAVAGVVLTQKAQRRLEGGDRVFRTYENIIRRAEDRLFGTISADGGLFALRRDYYEGPPPGATDDFFISTGAVAAGARIAFAEEAVAFEESISTARKHYRRRIRITVRGLASVWARRKLLNPFQHGAYAIALFFHKVLRRLAPVFMFIGLAALFGLALVDLRYRLAAAAVVIGVAISVIAILSHAPAPGIVKLPAYFLLHAWGLAVGCVLFLFGVRYKQWTPAKDAGTIAP